ncbi:MAG TPA: FtsX-like permease family protein, partial [Casimicrobiaceae bacterium]|nr:FtsX-like permease family protein [Casimicrobiaceae bacterium]
CVAVLSLALAISLNTTMYGVLDAMIAPKLDMRDPGDLYRLATWGDYKGRVDAPTRAQLLRGAMHNFEAVSYYAPDGRSDLAIEHAGRYALVRAAVVAPNFFAMLGVHPAAGRYLGSSDVGSPTLLVVISQGLAATLFVDGENPIGQMIDVDGAPHAVIGVLARNANLPGDTYEAWTLPPASLNLSALPYNLVRLRHGVRLSDAEAELALIGRRMADIAHEDPKSIWIQIASATIPQFHLKGFHYALIGAVAALLLIACANLANMQLARGIGRSRELAVRAAIGASRRDIIEQLLLESGLLAAIGLAVGLVATLWSADLLRAHVPPSVAEYVIAPQMSWRVLLFAVGACGLCVLLVGLLPAIRVSRVDPNELLKSGAGTGAHSRSRRQYGFMVAAQIGLSLALLSGTAMIVRQTLRVRAVNLGFDIAPLTTTTSWMPVPRDTTYRVAAHLSGIAAAMRGEPDVADAAASESRSVINHAVTVLTTSGVTRQVDAPLYGYTAVSPSYLRTEHRPIIAGRDFLDGIAAEPEVIVDRQTARVLWPGVSPIGMRIKLGADSSHVPWARVVGMIGDSPSRSTLWFNTAPIDKASRLGATYYLPGADDSTSVRAGRVIVSNVVTRAIAHPARMPIAMRHAMLPFSVGGGVRSQSMADAMFITQERAEHDFVAGMFTLFTTIALALAAFGVYAIVAHTVAERRRELGVRVALGASSRHILNIVLREGNVFALAGIAVGLWLTKSSIWWVRSFAIEDDAYNAPLFAAMALILFTVAVTAAFVPALRATRIDPVESLRNE